MRNKIYVFIDIYDVFIDKRNFIFNFLLCGKYFSANNHANNVIRENVKTSYNWDICFNHSDDNIDAK